VAGAAEVAAVAVAEVAGVAVEVAAVEVASSSSSHHQQVGIRLIRARTTLIPWRR